MNTQETKAVLKDITVEQATPVLSLYHFAIILTLLDEKAHETQYRKRMNPTEDEYQMQQNDFINQIRKIQYTLKSAIPPKGVPKLLQNSPHLHWLWEDELPSMSLENEDALASE